MSKSKVKNRTSDPASDESDESNQASSSTKFDLSCLRQPVMTSITGFEEVLRAYEAGTDEVNSLLFSWTNFLISYYDILSFPPSPHSSESCCHVNAISYTSAKFVATSSEVSPISFHTSVSIVAQVSTLPSISTSVRMAISIRTFPPSLKRSKCAAPITTMECCRHSMTNRKTSVESLNGCSTSSIRHATLISLIFMVKFRRLTTPHRHQKVIR